MKIAPTYLRDMVARKLTAALVPEGHPEITRRFNAGIHHALLQVPQGRLNPLTKKPAPSAVQIRHLKLKKFITNRRKKRQGYSRLFKVNIG